MDKPYLVVGKNGESRIFNLEDLHRFWREGSILPGDRIIDKQKGVQYPAIMLNDAAFKPHLIKRPQAPRLPEDENSGLYWVFCDGGAAYLSGNVYKLRSHDQLPKKWLIFD